MDEYKNIWELYGLKTNPFFTNPLLLFGGDIDIKLAFIGREYEVKRLQNLISNNISGRVIVAGDVGVGKTTFVNFVRSSVPDKVFFTHLKEIAVQPEWDGIDFILNTLSAIYTTIKLRLDINPKFIDEEILKKLELLVDIVERKNYSISLNIGVIGGGYGSNTNISIPSLTIHSLQVFFEDLIRELKKVGYKGVVLHYNNLEIIEEPKLIKLFNSIRDFIQTKEVLFIFIGDLGVPRIISKIKRVESIMSESPIILENLSITELKQLLDKRIQYLNISGLDSIKPYEDEIITKLYQLYNGNLRSILNSLSTAFNELVIDNRPTIMNSEILINTLSNTAKKRWLDKITDTEKEALFLILNSGEITNKEIAQSLKKQKQNISKITNRLLDIYAIKIKRTDGKEKYFTVDSSIKWFLLEKEKKILGKNNLTKNIQNEIQKILPN